MATYNLGKVSIVPKGAYSSGTEYEYLDWVTDSGNSYVYINATPSTGTALSTGTHWLKTAEKGDDGTDASLPLYFTASEVETTDWGASTTYDDYDYEADITCTNVTSAMYGEVVFGHDDAVGGNFSPVCLTGTGTVTIYAKTTPVSTVTIPLIKVVTIS